MYDHIPNGWAATVWFCFGMAVFVIPFLFFFAGNRSLYQRLLYIHKEKGEDVEMKEAKEVQKGTITVEDMGAGNQKGRFVETPRTFPVN